MIKLVILDLDGTLVDLCDVHYYALNEALEFYHFAPISYLVHLAHFNGLPTKKKLDLLKIDGDAKQWINDKKQELTWKAIKDHIKYDQSKSEIIHNLKKSNIKLACYSNSIRNTIVAALRECCIFEHFDLILSNEDVASPKPNPEGYVQIMKHFGMEPWETLIVEDSPVGIQAARESNANVLEVLNPKELTWSRIEGFIK